MTTRPGDEPGSESRRARRRAREVALQILYQCEVGHVGPAEALAAYGEIDQPGAALPAEAEAFVATLVTGTVAAIAEVDPAIAAAAEHWRPERMAIIDRAILRMAVYQLRHLPEVPPKVVINEAVELAHRFGGDESSRFVNGVLDAVRRQLEADGPAR